MASKSNEKGFSLLEAIIVVSVSLVLSAMTAKSMLSAVNNYQVDTAAKQLAAQAQLAHLKAPAHDTRYCVMINVSAGTYSLEAWNRNTGTWQLDSNSEAVTLPPNIAFSNTGLSIPPPEQSDVTQAANMTFNNIGLLYDTVNNTTSPGTCFFIQGGGATDAVCSTTIGRTQTYRLRNGQWQSF